MPSRDLWKRMEKRRAAYDLVNGEGEDMPVPDGDVPEEQGSPLADAILQLPSKPQAKPIFQRAAPAQQPAQTQQVVSNAEDLKKLLAENQPVPEGTTIDLDAIMGTRNDPDGPKQRGRKDQSQFGADPYYASARIKQKYSLANALLQRGMSKTENWGDVIAHPVMIYMAMKGLKEADALSEDYSRQASEYYAQAAAKKRDLEKQKLMFKAQRGGYLSQEDMSLLGWQNEEPPEGTNGQ